jgi:hypothetical protein
MTDKRAKAGRTLTVQKAMIERGEWTGGPIPYGCDVVCLTEQGKERWRVIKLGRYERIQVYDDGTKLECNGKEKFPRDRSPTERLVLRQSDRKERLEVVRKIFDWFATEAITTNRIAQRLNKEGVKATNWNGRWYPSLIDDMLANPVYIGKPAYNKNPQGGHAALVDGQVVTDLEPHPNLPHRAKLRRNTPDQWILPEKEVFPPIIPLDIWEKVQKKLRREGPPQKRAPRSDLHWLSGILYCGRCGQKMVGKAAQGRKSGTRGAVYHCGTYKRLGVDNPFGCLNHEISGDQVETIIQDYLNENGEQLEGVREYVDSQGLLQALMDWRAQAYSGLAMLNEKMWDQLPAALEGFPHEELEPSDMHVTFHGGYEPEVWRDVRTFRYRVPFKGRTVPVRVWYHDSNPGLCIDPSAFQENPDLSPLDIESICLALLDSRRTDLDQAIAVKKREIEALYRKWDELREFPTAAEMARQDMTRLEAELSNLKDQADVLPGDIREEISDEVNRLTDEIEEAREALSGRAYRRRAEALQRIVGRVVCHFDERRPWGETMRGFLTRVEIEPQTGYPGKVLNIRHEASPAPLH